MVLAIKISNEKARIGMVDSSGKLSSIFEVKIEKRKFWQNIYDAVTDKFEWMGLTIEDDIQKVSIVVSGFVDHERGIVRNSANMNWINYDLKSEGEDLFKKPVVVINDANAMALSEFWIGEGKQYSNILFYYVGVGIGGALVLDGKLYAGKNGYAGEFGHGGTNWQDKYRCECGLPNCVEALSSKKGIIKLFNESMESENSVIKKYFEGPITEISEIKKAYFDSNAPIEIYDLLSKSLNAIARHMSTMIMALDPEVIIIGGPVAELGQIIIKILERTIAKHVLQNFTDSLKMVFSTIPADNVLIGAGLYALKLVDTSMGGKV
ncbi:glucokinase [Spiroplasma sp. TIUS-1]|uniref:ROK family protein n=1 Tax=Spiroplasma sp. TIUS-1 TaxID=216963 RepID=UPI001398CF4D|nr:ROK family protein [Spiroplasma sp. TIUS-1]QHX35913.1 glucokinase [Spiroplasma sp. TIUS-1]